MFWRKKSTKLKPLPLPKGLSKDLLPIAHEINRLHESTMWSAQGQLEQMKLWRSLNLLFGLPAAVLAAVAGATGLSEKLDPMWVGTIALVSAGFGAALTTLNPSRRVTQSQSSGNAYLELQTAARQLLLVKLNGLTLKEAREELESLTERRDDTNKQADPPSTYAYWRAKRNIERNGGQSYLVDEDSNG